TAHPPHNDAPAAPTPGLETATHALATHTQAHATHTHAHATRAHALATAPFDDPVSAVTGSPGRAKSAAPARSVTARTGSPRGDHH
ncbi:hypothetical protein, partial [Nocardia wallacei]|uniref:hypothetical protein n=1 Tax=Nocardia wallacei TaxID=480035 RepID=UPI002455948B